MKSKAAKLAPTPRTFEDLRSLALDLQKRVGVWFDHHALLLSHRAEGAVDGEVLGWLDRLTDASSGRRSQAAGMLAASRFRSGQIDSARRWLEVAEGALPEEAEARRTAHEGLIPAWWLLGDDAPARAAFDARAQEMESRGVNANQANHLLFSLAALGRRTALVEELFPRVLAQDTYRADLLTPGVIALFADGKSELFDRIITRWSKLSSSYDRGLSIEVLRLLVRGGAPERYVGLTARHAIFERSLTAPALAACERRDPASAVAAAIEVLDAGDLFDRGGGVTRGFALSIVAAHAPDRAEACAASIPALSGPGPDRFEYLAALGRHDEARAGLCLENAASIAWVTTDRALAVEALKLPVEHALAQARIQYPPFFAQLVELGERAWVDDALGRHLEQIGAMKPRDRDLPARTLARTAGMVGRVDIALEAFALPTRALRRYAAQELACGCASAGDWTGAFAGLDRDPDDGGNGRAHTALLALIEVDCAAFTGAQAVPLRVR